MLPIIYRGHDDAGFFAHALGLGADKSPITVLPGNQRTSEARYICVLVVKDYFRMRANVKDTGEWHYSRIEPAILDDVRAGRAVLVFDLCNEGPAYNPEIFSELYAWIEANHLPQGRCVWLAQNRLIATAAKDHAGERSDLVRFEYYDYFIKITAWIFSPLSPDDALGTDPEVYIGRLFDANRKDKLLLCLNATPRLPRVLTVAALLHHRLMDESLVSFPGMHYVKPGVSIDEVLDFLHENPSLEYLHPSVDAVRRMPEIKVDDFREHGNALVEKIDPAVYERTFFSLVTESDFSDGQIERVTEKTAKSFCMGHPTLVVGNAHSVEFMTSFGFQDWGDVLNRSAESTASPAARFDSVFDEVLRQASRIKAGPREWLGSMREVGVHNFRYAVSGKFLASYVKNTDLKIVDRLVALVSH
jgi:hypothetical protein